jgi:hypothetical protein
MRGREICDLLSVGSIRHSSRNIALGSHGGERMRKRRRVWGEHLRRRSQARPGTPSPAQSHTRLGSTRCHSHALASIPLGVRLVRFPSGNLACARNRCESGKGVAGKEQRRGGHSDAALYPEMLGRRRTQAGLIIHTDSQRNVSRGNRVAHADSPTMLQSKRL